ncbi:MAG: glycosyltransferase, partial [Calditrichaeota bacterium]
YAQRFNPQVVVVPTTVCMADFQEFEPNLTAEPIVIGWIGSPSTQHYLFMIAECLKELHKKYDFVFRVIGAQKLNLPGIPLQLREWSLKSEAQEIASLTIGIMPLPDDAWTRGKGGYKLIQYLAAGVPACASRVGVNSEIIQDGVTGFLASSTAEWYQKLETLLTDSNLRRQFSRRGRQVVRDKYSLEGNYQRWYRSVTQFP